MNMSLILEALLPSLNESPGGFKKLDETTCKTLCQHPGCWASVRRQQKGIACSLSPLEIDSDDSDSDLDLPKQSICNLLTDYGESPTDRYPLSTGGRPSHQWESNSHTITRSTRSVDSYGKLKAPHNTKGSLYSKGTAVSTRHSRIPLIEVQEVFDKTDLNSQWDETFVTKQYYMWIPNPRVNQKKNLELPLSRETYQSMPVLMKDMTECMVPPEIEQKREDTIMFDDWPVLKKKSLGTRSPLPRPVPFNKAASVPSAPPTNDLDTEGINELLALPKDALMKVLEHTKKSDFTSKGKLRTILQEYVQYDERARMALNAHELFQPRKMQILKQPMTSSHVDQSKPPIFHMDDEMILDRMSSVNTPVKDKDSVGNTHSVDSFPRYKKPLPKIQGKYEEPMKVSNSSLRVINKKARIPSISLGLPELPSGVKTTRPFSYNKKSLVDFSLGPVISPPSTERSSLSGDRSEHGTTIKVHASSSVFDFMANERTGDQAIHSVSPALSTHVPHAPAVTPATFMSPTKSAPVFRDYKDLSRDPTSISVSQKAMPPSRDVRETTLLSSMSSNVSQRQTLSPMDTKLLGTPDEIALDTINETARENLDVEGSVNSSHRAVADVNEIHSPRKEEMATLALEPSALTSIHTGASPVLKSARSAGSCPSPEQWPLISESSFENLMPRHSVSEPALSARNRNLIVASLDDDIQGPIRDFARKVLDDKISVESPAPPPPSPEPKDRETRPRKELKSRDSLSMAPLFEVNEVEEGSPIRELGNEDSEMADGKDGERRLKQVRQIHAVIPRAKIEHDKKDESDENDDVMVSQITVTHVTPKGPDSNAKKGEKVQETFLNVDIPAEEISSLKAEHGSSHQEDISSNDTVVQSNSTTTGSSVSAALAPPEVLEPKEENEKDARNERHILEYLDSDTLINEREKTLSLEDDDQQRENSGKQHSEGSTISPELMCDSARFLNHELVSPVDAELEEDEESGMLPILNESNAEETYEKTDPQPETAVAEEPEQTAVVKTKEEAIKLAPLSMEMNEVQESKVIQNMELHGTTITNTDDDIEPPGSFFFRTSSSQSTPQDNSLECQKTQEVKADTIIDKESKSISHLEPGINEKEENVDENIMVRPEKEMTSDQDQNMNDGNESNETAVMERETSSILESAEESKKENKKNEDKEEDKRRDENVDDKVLITAVMETGIKESLEPDDSDAIHIQENKDEEVTNSIGMDLIEEKSIDFDINKENKSSENDDKDSVDKDKKSAVTENDIEKKENESSDILQTMTENTLVATREAGTFPDIQTNVVQDKVSSSDCTQVQHCPIQETGNSANDKDDNTDAIQSRLEPEGSDTV